MKTNITSTVCGALIGVAALIASNSLAQPTTSFTYQGQLTENDNPVTGLYDLRFQLFDATTGGTSQGGSITSSSVGVTNGLFTVLLDFGGTLFATGADLWLEIASRTNGPASFGILAPRQRITSTPYAVTARNVTGSVTASQVPNLDASKITSGTFTSAQIPSLDASKITSGTFIASQIPSLDASKVTSGTFSSARIPSLDASKISTGTLADGRLSGNVALLDRVTQIFTGDTNAFLGRVGVGTSNPLADLDVRALHTSVGSALTPVATNVADILNLQVGLNANAGSNGIAFWENTGGFGMKIGYDGTASGDQNKLVIYGTANTNLVVFQNGGNVGLGVSTPTNRLQVAGGSTLSGPVTIGDGTPVTKILSAAASLDFPSTVASSDLSITLTGAAIGDPVSLGLPFNPPANTLYTAWVSSANTVTVRFLNLTGVAINPGPGTFRVAIMQF